MKHVGKKTASILLTLVMMLSFLSVTPSIAKAESVGSSWTVNADGTLSISEATATKAVGSLTEGNMILIGTKGGTIVEGSLPSGTGIVTKISTASNAAMIRYTTATSKADIIAAIEAVKFTGTTTQVHIDVTYGETTDSMQGVDNFGVLNADGEAHVYKLINHGSAISWIAAFDGAVHGTDTLGGLKGYLATVTTREEAALVRDFYNSSEAGTWIAGTSLKYSTDSNSDYASAAKVTPENYSAISDSITKVTGQKISATTGAYYCPFGSASVSNSSYYDYYYWACGPEEGQAISTALWASGEPNNSDSTRGGETCIVSPWGGNAAFNDFSPFNTVSKYFLEFSAYDKGLVTGAAYNSITIYKVTLDGNGAAGSIAPMEKIKGETLTIRTDCTGLTNSGDTWFAGWYASTSDTDYSRVVTYSENAPVTLYAHWSKFGYTTQYDPVAATDLVYNGDAQLLIDTSDGYGVWRVNAPTDGNTNSYTYWYSRSENSGYAEGTVYDSSKAANAGYAANVSTGCAPLYGTNAGTYTIYWNWNCQAGNAQLGSVTVTIEPKSLTDTSITVETDPQNGIITYNGKSQAPIITVNDGARGANGKALTNGKDYEVEYEGTGTADYTRSATAPTKAGTYKAIITGKGNYKDVREIEFIIEKAEVAAPAITAKLYTGKKLTADVEENALYTVTENDGGIAVGNYDVVLTLTDSANYKWKGSEDVDNTLIFKIVPEGTNIVTVNMEGWTYGEAANDPVSTASFGNDTVVFSYSSSLNGEYTSDVPTNAGIWYVKAYIEETENYGAGEAINSFEIKKAASTAAKVTANNRTYDAAKKPLVSVDDSTLTGGKMYYALGTDAATEPDVSAYSTDIPEATDVGTYYVWYKVIGDDNYKDVEAVCITVTIGKITTSINTEVNISEDAPDVKVSNLNDEFALKLLTDEEKEEYENGTPVIVYLDVNVFDKSKVPAVDLAAANKIITDDGYTYGECLDLSLWKRIGTNDAIQIHDTNGNLVSVQITIPDELKNVPEGYTRTYRIVRVHNGKTTVLAEGTESTFTIRSDKFSSYFILYKDVKTATEAVKTAPKTGDSMPIVVLIVLMIGAAGTLGFIDWRKKY